MDVQNRSLTAVYEGAPKQTNVVFLSSFQTAGGAQRSIQGWPFTHHTSRPTASLAKRPHPSRIWWVSMGNHVQLSFHKGRLIVWCKVKTDIKKWAFSFSLAQTGPSRASHIRETQKSSTACINALLLSTHRSSCNYWLLTLLLSPSWVS